MPALLRPPSGHTVFLSCSSSAVCAYVIIKMDFYCPHLSPSVTSSLTAQEGPMLLFSLVPSERQQVFNVETAVEEGGES